MPRSSTTRPFCARRICRFRVGSFNRRRSNLTSCDGLARTFRPAPRTLTADRKVRAAEGKIMPNVRDLYFTSTATLADQIGSPDLVVVDASWYLPALRRDAHA